MSESLAKCQGIAKTSSHGLDNIPGMTALSLCTMAMALLVFRWIWKNFVRVGNILDGILEKEIDELPLASHRRFAWQFNAQR